jgi:molybdate transport system substrate-binding protein
MLKRHLMPAAFVLLILPVAGSGQTAPLRLLCSNAIRMAMEQLLPEAQRAIGRPVSVRYDASTALRLSIDQGEAFDVAILTPDLIEALITSGRLRSGTRTDVASVDLAVGIKAGSRKDDVQTPEGMKKRLLAARSLTWTEAGASSAANIAMVRALGIEDELTSRIVLQKVSRVATETVARGENELVLAPRSEVQSVAGVEVLGLFPKEFQRPVVVTAGIGANAQDVNAAAALVRFFISPAVVPALEAAGMRPGAK